LRKKTFFLALIFVVLLVDQSTKHLARVHLQHQDMRHYLGETVTLLYAENAGAFLSLGADLPAVVRQVILNGIVGIGLAVAAWVLFTGRMHSKWDELALAFILAGGVGNLIDRVRNHGRVTDFIYLAAGPLHTGVFNVADMAITSGVVWLMLSWMFVKAPKPSHPEHSQPESNQPPPE
jgi:signal peptidase II